MPPPSGDDLDGMQSAAPAELRMATCVRFDRFGPRIVSAHQGTDAVVVARGPCPTAQTDLDRRLRTLDTVNIEMHPSPYVPRTGFNIDQVRHV
jgi:hypothetical protein